jgi:hypothetical protein
MAWLTVGWEIKSFAAALLILPVSTTAINILKCLMVTLSPAFLITEILIGFTYDFN